MTEKRFTYENHKVKDNLTGEFHSSNRVSVNVLNSLNDENEQLKTERLTWLKNQEELECLSEENEQLKQEKEEIKSKAESFVELYEKDFGKNYYTPPRSGKTVRPQLWIVRKILDEIGILELYGDVE